MDSTQSSLKQRIEQDVRSNRVHIFMKGTPQIPQCGFSQTACEALRAAGAGAFGSTDVLEDLPAYRAALLAITRWPTIPQVFIGGEFVGGADIVREMLASGELRRKVEAATG